MGCKSLIYIYIYYSLGLPPQVSWSMTRPGFVVHLVSIYSWIGLHTNLELVEVGGVTLKDIPAYMVGNACHHIIPNTSIDKQGL